MKIKVNQTNIENAKPRDSHRCMIADAIAEAHPKAKYISVDLQSIRWSDMDKGERYVCLTPPAAQINILEYDHGHEVHPFEFNVSPAYVQKVGWARNHPNTSRKGKVYNKGKSSPRPRKERQFGIRMLT